MLSASSPSASTICSAASMTRSGVTASRTASEVTDEGSHGVDGAAADAHANVWRRPRVRCYDIGEFAKMLARAPVLREWIVTAVPFNEWLISVDDHVIEPPNVWTDRLPAKYQDVGPRMKDSIWLYEDKVVETAGLSVCAGKDKEEFSLDPVTFEDMRPGAYDPIARVADMDRAGIAASLCFPSFPRFCGQIFWEARDKELAMLCVRAYNDWMIDEWCGTVPGRFIPLTIIPLWDPV